MRRAIAASFSSVMFTLIYRTIDQYDKNGEWNHVILAVNAEKPYFSYTISVGENLKSSSLWILQPDKVRVDIAVLSTHVIVIPVSAVKFVYWLTSSQTIVNDPAIRRCFGGRNLC